MQSTKTHFHGAGSVPGLHEFCGPLILPADEVMERNPSFPVKVNNGSKMNLPQKRTRRGLVRKGVLQWFSFSFPSSHMDFT